MATGQQENGYGKCQESTELVTVNVSVNSSTCVTRFPARLSIEAIFYDVVRALCRVDLPSRVAAHLRRDRDRGACLLAGAPLSAAGARS